MSPPAAPAAPAAPPRRKTPRPGTARADAPVLFSRRAYLRITLGISVAFGLLALPSGILPRKYTSPTEGLLMFTNGVLFFELVFVLNYLLRYRPNPVQRWLQGQALWLNRLLRGLLTVLVVGLYSVGRYHFDNHFGVSLDETTLGVVVALSQVVAVIGLAFQLAIELLESSRYLSLEVEELKREQLQARYESLKQQLSPHFLFNSLSTLSGLVHEEPRAAELFIEEMAQVYRYLLQHSEQTAVPLRDELRFLRSYTYLLQMRFGEGIRLEIDLPSDVLDRPVPPMALQLLAENAVKHNVVSKRRPLVIQVDFVAPASLRIRNPCYPRLTPEPSSGVGLKNLTNRIRLLNQQNLLVEQTPDEFCVYLPLPA